MTFEAVISLFKTQKTEKELVHGAVHTPIWIRTGQWELEGVTWSEPGSQLEGRCSRDVAEVIYSSAVQHVGHKMAPIIHGGDRKQHF